MNGNRFARLSRFVMGCIVAFGVMACACFDKESPGGAHAAPALPPFEAAANATLGEFVTDRVLIRYALLPQPNPVVAQGRYVAWRSHLRLGDDLKNGPVDRGLIDQFLTRAFAHFVGYQKDKAALVVRVNDAPPIMLMNSTVVKALDEQAGDFISGSVVAPYVFFDGSPQTLTVSANVTLSEEVNAPIVGKILQLARWIGMSSVMPGGVVKVATRLENPEIDQINQTVNKWLSSGGNLGNRTKVFTAEEVSRLQRVQVVVFDKPMNDPQRKAAVSVEIEPTASVSMLTQKLVDGRPEYSDLTRDVLDKKFAGFDKSYRDLLPEKTRGDLRENDKSYFTSVCEEARKTYIQHGFSNISSNNDALALTWAALAQSRYYENHERGTAVLNCPDRADVERFEALKIAWKAAPTRPVDEVREAQKRSMTQLSALLRRGVERPNYFGEKISFYAIAAIVKELVAGKTEEKDRGDVLGLLRRISAEYPKVSNDNPGLQVEQFAMDGMEDAGRIPFSITKEDSNKKDTVIKEKYELWAYFEDKDATVEGKVVRRISRLEITK